MEDQGERSLLTKREIQQQMFFLRERLLEVLAEQLPEQTVESKEEEVNRDYFFVVIIPQLTSFIQAYETAGMLISLKEEDDWVMEARGKRGQ